MNKQKPVIKLEILSDIEKDVEEKTRLFKDLGKKVSFLYDQSNVSSKLAELAKIYEKAMPAFDAISKVINQQELFDIPSILKDINGPIDKISENILSISNDLENGSYLMSSEDIRRETENKIIESLEDIKKLLEKVIDRNNKPTYKELTVQDKVLVQANNWNEVEIKFKDNFTVEVYIKGNYVKKIGCEEMGLYGKGRDKKPNAQWQFLLIYSVICKSDKAKADKQAMKDSLGKVLGIEIKDNYIEKIKSNLSKRLKKAFGLADDPFYFYKDYGYYYSKFKIEPIPGMRGSGELHVFTSQYNDNITPQKHKDYIEY
jgi:hypothetical protein